VSVYYGSGISLSASDVANPDVPSGIKLSWAPAIAAWIDVTVDLELNATREIVL
jgi:hypothetical protein